MHEQAAGRLAEQNVEEHGLCRVQRVSEEVSFEGYVLNGQHLLE